MKQGLINGNKNKLTFLLFFSLFAITVLSISGDQPIAFITANKKVVSLLLWIVIYILAQFVVAVFVGRIIRGPSSSG
ncbi:MAG: hypothetical protein R6X34_01940 [Chloroflexota bacterium]